MKPLVRPRVRSTPIVLGLLMSASLIVALVGDGLWDGLACLLLIGVVVYGGIKAFK